MNATIDKGTIQSGESLEVLIMPFGVYPQRHGNVVVNQICDEAAGKALCNAFSGDVLVDCDHVSENDGSTEASAWITGLRVDKKGVVATFKFTDKGAEAVANRRYRFVSPAWILGDDGRPNRLHSCALTNTPNLPVSPILNAALPQQTNHPNQGNPPMDKLKELLGLGADATEDDIIDAVSKLQERMTEMEAEKAEAEANAFAAENADKCEDEDCLKNAYMKDPELAKTLVSNLKKAGKPQMARRVCNSATARVPSIGVATEPVDHKARLAQLPCTAREQYFREHSAEL